MAAFITAVVVAVVTALLGMASYLYQKRTDRQVELSKQQREAYQRYMQSYYDWTLTKEGTREDEEAKNKYRKAYFKLFPLASDSFLKAAFAFHTFSWEEPYPDFNKKEDRKEFDEKWTTLVLEMRKDAEIKSQITEKEIEQHIPWSWRPYENIQDANVTISAT